MDSLRSAGELNQAADPVRILFVCTANICRSPAAEYLARARFGESAAVFRSAGFLTSGEVCPDSLVQSLAEVGIDAGGHRSYRLDEASLQSADLVLTMEGQHVQKATIAHPPSYHRIMPLKEAAEVVASMPDTILDIEDLVAVIEGRRDPRTYLTTRWDVDDPYRRKMRDYRRAVREIDQLVTNVVGRLRL